jgi:hypothetical protein
MFCRLGVMLQKFAIGFGVGLTLAATPACGGNEPPPKTEADAPAIKVENGGDGLHGIRTSSEIGGLNEDAVDSTFKKSLAALQGCLHDGSERLEFLGGSVSFFLKVDEGGRVEELYLEHSTLGDRDTERCMLGTLRKKRWPKPVGGMHGLARKSFDFDAPGDVRPPVDWSPDEIKTTLKKLSGKIADCRGNASGQFEATAYISAEGSVMSASVTPPNADSEAAVDCLIDAIRGGSFPSPGSWPAKVTFQL